MNGSRVLIGAQDPPTSEAKDRDPAPALAPVEVAPPAVTAARAAAHALGALLGVAPLLHELLSRPARTATAIWTSTTLLAMVSTAFWTWYRPSRPKRWRPEGTTARWGFRSTVVLLAVAWWAWAMTVFVHATRDDGLVAAAMLLLASGLLASMVAVDRWALLGWLGIVHLGAALGAMVVGVSPELAAIALFAGAVVGMLGLRTSQLLDSARRARAENEQLVRQLRQQVALVEAADAEKSRFLGAASHDLRQPMHAIGLFAAALEASLRQTEHHAKAMSMVKAIDALDASFTAMLDISKLDAGTVRPKLQAFPIRDSYRRLHLHCAGLAEERGLSLRFKTGGKVVTSDPLLLERILSNLIVNAIRYTDDGGVTVLTRSRAEHTSVEVWDTGPGIAADELSRVFDEFYQVDNPGRDRSRGLGLGLSIVKRLVLLLGHRLEVRSVLGRGTVFKLLMQRSELADMGSVILGADTVPACPDEDRTVLVVDDESPVREGMRELLQGWGFTVLLAASGTEAIREVRRHASVIHVIVSDLRLGKGIDGLDVIEAVRLDYGAPLPAILVTGDTASADVKRAHASGHPVLFKPVRPRDLYAALRAIP